MNIPLASHTVTSASHTLSLSTSHNSMSSQYGLPFISEGSRTYSEEGACHLRTIVEQLILDLNQPICLIPRLVLLNTVLTPIVCASPWGLGRAAWLLRPEWPVSQEDSQKGKVRALSHTDLAHPGVKTLKWWVRTPTYTHPVQAASCQHLYYDQLEIITVFKTLGVTYSGRSKATFVIECYSKKAKGVAPNQGVKLQAPKKEVTNSNETFEVYTALFTPDVICCKRRNHHLLLTSSVSRTMKGTSQVL